MKTYYSHFLVLTMQTSSNQSENDSIVEISALLSLANRARLKSRDEETRIIKEAIRQVKS
jgi:hypothetical protein